MEFQIGDIVQVTNVGHNIEAKCVGDFHIITDIATNRHVWPIDTEEILGHGEFEDAWFSPLELRLVYRYED